MFYRFLIVLFFSLNIFAQESVKYNLSGDSIESVAYSIAPDSTYSIFIKLNKAGTIEFDEFTKNNNGKFLSIYKNGHILQEAEIKARITSGIISINNLKTSNEVIKYIKILIK